MSWMLKLLYMPEQVDECRWRQKSRKVDHNGNAGMHGHVKNILLKKGVRIIFYVEPAYVRIPPISCT